MQFTGSEDFPKKICSTRWVESGEVSKQAESIIDNLKKFLDEATKRKSLIQKLENNDNFIKMVKHLNDKLLLPKLAFFSTIADDNFKRDDDDF